MQRHYCSEERTWLDFEGYCSWCGMTEHQAQEQIEDLRNSDQRFREIMEKLNKNARPDITDD